jgi:hypothetical protein
MTHKAAPRSMTDMDRRRVAVGLGHYICKCGRRIVEVEKPGVDGFGPEAFFWRHLPRKAASA